MKITEITMKKAEFAFNKPFEIAFAVLYGFETMVLRIDTDEGITGYGRQDRWNMSPEIISIPAWSLRVN